MDIGAEQRAIENRYHTNKTKEYRIPIRTEKSTREPTRTRRHQHHERKHHTRDPTKRHKRS